MKCFNLNCHNDTKKGKFCSLKCRNLYINQNFIDYDKVKKSFEFKKLEKIEAYEKAPKRCQNCQDPIEFEKRRNRFCSCSCSVTFSNTGKKFTSERKENIAIGVRIKSLLRTKKNLRKCLWCGKDHNNKKFCSNECYNKIKNANLSEYERYKLDCQFKFDLKEFPEEFDFNLIKKYGWYKPSNRGGNLDGVSRDHILSIKDGYDQRIDPKIISHPSNCRLVIHRENQKKSSKSEILLDQLLEKIRIFNEKYKWGLGLQ